MAPPGGGPAWGSSCAVFAFGSQEAREEAAQAICSQPGFGAQVPGGTAAAHASSAILEVGSPPAPPPSAATLGGGRVRRPAPQPRICTGTCGWINLFLKQVQQQQQRACIFQYLTEPWQATGKPVCAGAMPWWAQHLCQLILQAWGPFVLLPYHALGPACCNVDTSHSQIRTLIGSALPAWDTCKGLGQSSGGASHHHAARGALPLNTLLCFAAAGLLQGCCHQARYPTRP